MQFNHRQLLSEDTTPKGLQASKATRKENKNAVIICSYSKTGIGAEGSSTKSMSSMLTTAPSSSLYPGSLIAIDKNLVNGQPTVIGTKANREAFTLSINGIPNLKHNNLLIPASSLSQTKGLVQDAINKKLNEFFTVGVKKGYTSTAGSSQWTYAKLYNSKQVAAKLDFTYDGSSTNVKAMLDAKTSSDKTTIYALYKQVFYKVNYQPNNDLNQIFSHLSPKSKEAWSEFTNYINPKTPAGYISEVSYGQMILVRMTFKNSDLKVDAEAAVKASMTDVKLSAHIENATKNAEIQVTLIGGDQEKYGEIINAPTIEDIQKIVKDMTVFGKNTSTVPIAYVTRFLGSRDVDGTNLKNKIATINFTSDYVQEKCKNYDNGYVKFVHDGGYVANFSVKYKVKGKSENCIYKGKTAGFSKTCPLPGDANNIDISAEAHTGLVWQPLGEILRKSWGSVRNCTYTVQGTTLNRKYSSEPAHGC